MVMLSVTMSGTPEVLSAKRVGHFWLLVFAVWSCLTRSNETYRSPFPYSSFVVSHGYTYRQKSIKNVVIKAIYGNDRALGEKTGYERRGKSGNLRLATVSIPLITICPACCHVLQILCAV